MYFYFQRINEILLFAVLFCCSVKDVRANKCRVVQKTTLTCVEATPEDFPKSKNEKIEWVLFSKSNFPIITKEQMQNFPSLTDLHAENNGIEKIEKNAFSAANKLNWVDVSFNKLTTISPDIFKDSPKIYYFNASGNPDLVIPKNKPFLKAPSLQWLLLQQSNIAAVYSETFQDVPGLKVLSLSDNALTTLPPDVFVGLKNLYSLDLSKNKFTSLPVTLFEPLKYISLYLGENPWNCDCDLNPTIQWAKNRRLKDEVRCAKPENKKWQEMIHMKCSSEVEVL